MMDKNRIIIVAGMSRTGTTFLYHNLQKHPNIYVPARKEVGYFSHHFEHDTEWYFNFFKNMNPDQVGFDICGMYFSVYESIERIIDFNPDAKVILGIRDPKEWIVSLYEQYTKNFDVPPFQEFIQGCFIIREGKKIALDFTNNRITKTILQYKDKFKDNLLLYDFNILRANPLSLLKEIELLSGVNGYFAHDNFTDKKINARDKKRIKLMDHLLHKKGVAETIVKIFPHQMIVGIRNKLDQFSVGEGKNKTKNLYKYSDEEIELVDSIFEQDSILVKKLFKDKPFVYGNEHL